jgi:molybdate-binding protein
MEWQRVAGRVAREISAGRLAEGERLPGVRRLAREAGCSAGTAARAYAALRDAGLIRGAQRERFEVAPGAAAHARSWDPGAPRPGAAAAPGRAGSHGAGVVRLAGSDDPALDLLLRESGGSATFAPGARGSVPGLAQLARGSADAAAVHLLDVSSGRWNEGFARSALAGQPVVLVHLWQREQGLVVPRGNPKRIRAVADLAGQRVSWRAPGAGSRLLLERLMLQEGIEPRPERGVQAESHLAVAAAVAAGAADAGLAVRAVGDSLGLDWVPVATEWFELALAKTSMEAIDPLLDVLASASVHGRVAALPGYDLGMTGERREPA